MANMLAQEEYIEQAYLFRSLHERLQESVSTQDLLFAVRDEVLATTKLPMALEYMLAELKHSGVVSPAMKKISHYFTPFQSYIVSEAEDERGRFDMRIAMEILQKEAEYRSKSPTPAGMFLYHFEVICRNRLRYDRGLDAVREDPIYDSHWAEWIAEVNRQVGILDLADLIYLRSEYYQEQQARMRRPPATHAVLFGSREGRIALANRRKDPLLLFSALHRHLGYPVVPRHKQVEVVDNPLPQLFRRVEQLEQRLKLVEEEQRGGFDLSKFYKQPDSNEGKRG